MQSGNRIYCEAEDVSEQNMYIQSATLRESLWINPGSPMTILQEGALKFK